MSEIGYVIVGTPIFRAGAFVIDKFLENQREIQNNYPSAELVLATEQKDYIEELKGMLKRWGVRGDVILFEVVKPDSARILQPWTLACGREAIRQYTLSKMQASHLLFIDSDMTCDPHIINIMLKELGNSDIVASGYPGRLCGIQTGGIGCTLFTRETLNNITFRCYEFSNHRVLADSDMLDMDTFDRRLKFKHGYLLAIDHYDRDGSSRHIEPHPVSLLRKVTNSRLLRYILLKVSMKCKHNLPIALYELRLRFFK